LKFLPDAGIGQKKDVINSLQKKIMTIFLIVIHILVCIALIMIVLLQTGKGADMGAAFGGGSSQTLFGSTGASTFLSKATTGAAIIFMITSLGLAYLSSHRAGSESVVTNTPAPIESSAQPATTPPSTTESGGAQPDKQSE
jgi:preprotein translocase subunit SecG